MFTTSWGSTPSTLLSCLIVQKIPKLIAECRYCRIGRFWRPECTTCILTCDPPSQSGNIGVHCTSLRAPTARSKASWQTTSRSLLCSNHKLQLWSGLRAVQVPDTHHFGMISDGLEARNNVNDVADKVICKQNLLTAACHTTSEVILPRARVITINL